MAEDFKNYFRPTDFNRVVGQDNAVSVLRGMIKKNSIAHAILLDGPWGTGKTTLARIFAKHICCLDYDKENFRPCGKCSSCKGFDVGNRVDRHISITEVDAGVETGIDFYRNLISNSKRKPLGKYNVYIIDEAHKMSKPAQDAFLKSLEEPPKQSIFIFCTTDSQKLLPTIHSRLRRITLTKVSKDNTIKYLNYICKKEGKEFDKKVIHKIASVADGHLRDAASILESCVNAQDDGKEVSVSNITKIVEGSNIANPFKVAGDYLFSLYRGSYNSIKYISSLDDNGLFVLFTKVLASLHTEAMYSVINKDLACKTSDSWKYRNLCSLVEQYASTMDLSTKVAFIGSMADMSNDLVTLIERMQNFGVNNPRFLGTSFTFVQAKVFKSIKPKK